jgi:hypothetical protein
MWKLKMGKIHDRIKAKTSTIREKSPPVTPEQKLHVGLMAGKSRLAEICATVMKEAKGKYMQNCNVTACQKPGATWWNSIMKAYYCRSCAWDINRAAVQFRDPVFIFETKPVNITVGEEQTVCPFDGERTTWMGERMDANGVKFQAEQCYECNAMYHAYEPETQK